MALEDSSKRVSGYWSESQAEYYDALLNPEKRNVSPRSGGVQTPPKKPIGSTPTYSTRNKGSK